MSGRTAAAVALTEGDRDMGDLVDDDQSYPSPRQQNLRRNGWSRTCTEPGCDSPHHAHGLCHAHYAQVRFRAAQALPSPRAEITWTPELHAEVVALVQQGFGPAEIARRVGLKKNQVSGYLWRRGLSPDNESPPESTTMSRLQALHDRIDAVLRATGADSRHRPPQHYQAAPDARI